MWEYIKKLFSGVGVYAAIYILALASNGLFGTKFELPQLLELIKWMVANHFINSGFNTTIPAIEQLKGGTNNGTR